MRPIQNSKPGVFYKHEPTKPQSKMEINFKALLEKYKNWIKKGRRQWCLKQSIMNPFNLVIRPKRMN